MKKIINIFVALLVLVSAIPVSAGTAATMTLGTTAATNISSVGATLNGLYNVSASSAQVWFQYGTSQNNLNNYSAIAIQTTGTGTYSANITGLTPNTTYYFKAYGSQGGNSYFGNTAQSFTTTNAVQSISVSTLAASSVGENSVVFNGYLTNASQISTTRYFKWGTSSTSLTHTLSVSGTTTSGGPFSSTLSGLTPSTTYYFKAYATNSMGTVSGNQVFTFTTLSAPVQNISVTTLAATNITSSSATLNGYLTTNSSSTRYFKWGTSSNSLTHTLSVTGTQNSNSPFSANLSGLTPNTNYYFRAYANNGTTVQSTTHQFLTSQTTTIYYECNDGIDNDGNGLTDYPQDPGCTSPTDNNEYTANNSSAPVVSTGSTNNIYETGATLTGTVNSNNSYTYYWFEYGTNQNNLVQSQNIAFGTSNGNVAQSIGNLISGTNYSYKLCASNSQGSDCGVIRTFTTTQNACPPCGNCGNTTNCGNCTSNCPCPYYNYNNYNCPCTNNCNTGQAPTVNTSSAGNITNNSAIVYGFVDPSYNNNSQVWFKYGLNGNTNYTAYPSPSSVSSAQNVSASLSNLQQNSVYSFQICASNQYGQNCGNILSFTTNTNAYVPVQPYYQPNNYQTNIYQNNYQSDNYEQKPIIIYTNNDSTDYGYGESALATLKINSSKRNVVAGDLISYSITLENISSRKLKDVVINVNAPMDMTLTSTSYGELIFSTNSVLARVTTLAVGENITFNITASVAKNTRAQSFVIHSDASYLNTKTGERETITAELMNGMERNNMLAGLFGTGVGSGLIWFLIAIFIILLAFLAFSRKSKKEEVKSLPPSRWPTNS